jgi:paraquat-inducible protein B
MKRQALLLGTFVLGALALIVAAIVWLSGANPFERQLRGVVYFQGSVSGLYVGAPVTFRGVAVGQVEGIDIEIDSRTLEARIPVRVRLRPDSVQFTGERQAEDIQSLVARGLRARLAAQSFVTGQKYIDLDFIRDSPARFARKGDPSEIPTLNDRFDALIDQVADLPLADTVNDIRETLKALQVTLQSSQATLDVVAKEISQTAQEARKTLAAATTSLEHVEGSATAAMASIQRLTDTTRKTVDTAQPELQRALVGAREATESARQAADAARLAMSRVAEFSAPEAPLRRDIDSAVRDLSQAARGLRDWSELLEEQPNAIIFGRERR